VSVERTYITKQAAATSRLAALSRTRKKLREAKFFLTELTAEDSGVMGSGSEAADFYLSAFFTSARAVTFVLARENTHHYQAWSQKWFAQLTEDERDLMNLFVEQKSEKEGSATTEGTFTLVKDESIIEHRCSGAIW
jgi:hypothetical protein